MMQRFLAALACAAVVLAAPARAAAQEGVCAGDPAAFRALRERVLHPGPDQVIAVAHRGCFAAAPENTPLAIEACWRLGVEVVENDVRSTKDGELVVVHDGLVDRVTDGMGYIDDLTMADIEKLRMRERDGGPGAYLTNQPVPTLREYYRAAKNRVMINLELKPSESASWKTLLEKSIQIAREEGVVDQLLLKVPDVRNHGKSSKEHMLDTLKIPADVALMPIIWESATPLAQRLDQLERFKPAGYELTVQDRAYYDQVRASPRLAGRPVMAVAVQPYWSGGLDDTLSMRDPDAGWGRLVALGANTIMTDRPEALIRYLESKGLHRTAAPVCRR